MRDILVAGNWKMNGSTAFNTELVTGIVAGVPESERVKLLICPPFPYLSAVAAAGALVAAIGVYRRLRSLRFSLK